MSRDSTFRLLGNVIPYTSLRIGRVRLLCHRIAHFKKRFHSASSFIFPISKLRTILKKKNFSHPPPSHIPKSSHLFYYIPAHIISVPALVIPQATYETWTGYQVPAASQAREQSNLSTSYWLENHAESVGTGPTWISRIVTWYSGWGFPTFFFLHRFWPADLVVIGTGTLCRVVLLQSGSICIRRPQLGYGMWTFFGQLLCIRRTQ